MIVSFGSINMDLVVHTPRFPLPGETLTGSTFTTVPGGKGANQAVAAARLGARTSMVGCVGADAFGSELRAALQAAGCDISGVTTRQDTRSGVAAILIDGAAENMIIVVPGANGSIAAADLTRLDAALTGARVLLLQLEIPLAAVVAAAELARRRSVTVVLDPAPAQELPAELYPLVDILTPNEHEAAILTGTPLADETSVAAAATALRNRGARSVVITCGTRGVYASGPDVNRFYPAIPVTAVDSVAAGDAFNGALAVALAEGRPFTTAVQWGLAGGACAVTRPGAQAAMPDRAALLAMLAKQPPTER